MKEVLFVVPHVGGSACATSNCIWLSFAECLQHARHCSRHPHICYILYVILLNPDLTLGDKLVLPIKDEEAEVR